MTVEELLNNLQKVKDKTIPITVAITTYSQGSEWTGVYESGSKPVEITKTVFSAGDKLAGVNELDEVDHIEIITDDSDF